MNDDKIKIEIMWKYLKIDILQTYFEKIFFIINVEFN